MDDSFFCVTDSPTEYFDCFTQGLHKRNPGETEFHQAVGEVAETIVPFIFQKSKVFESPNS